MYFTVDEQTGFTTVALRMSLEYASRKRHKYLS